MRSLSESVFDNDEVATQKISDKVKDFYTVDNSNIRSVVSDCINNRNGYDIKMLPKLDTSKVTNMQWLFEEENIKTLDLSKWDVSNVVSMDEMFQNCTKLTKLNLGGWKLDSLETAERMFNGCKSLQEIDLTGWYLTPVYNIPSWYANTKRYDDMFTGCKKLKKVYLTYVDDIEDEESYEQVIQTLYNAFDYLDDPTEKLNDIIDSH